MESIVALATPPIKSALAIIRLSGDDCYQIVSKCIHKDLSSINDKTLLYSNFYNDKNEIIDQLVLAVYKGPRSFTGEDLIELFCHGSMLIANEIILTLISHGARYATNGEYSSRAFLNRKIDLIQAEAINDVINATTKEAKRLSIMSLEGKTTDVIKPIKKEIADLISLIEVNIDYPEYHDIEQITKEKILVSTKRINDMISSLVVRSEKAMLIKEGIKVALIGKPNVGKSSLLNALIGEEKAIVTNIPGTTRDVVEGDINLDGILIHLLDTAGIRESNNEIESIGINKSKSMIKNADLTIVLIDATNITDEDKQIIELVKDVPHIIAYNKADKLDLNNKSGIYISALNKNVTSLTKEIKKVIGLENDVFEVPSLNNSRQIGLLKKAQNSLKQAQNDAKNDLSIDLISVNITDAFHYILEILGEEKQDAISMEIFSRFCIGK